jgi:hypothetical protein
LRPVGDRAYNERAFLQAASSTRRKENGQVSG